MRVLQRILSPVIALVVALIGLAVTVEVIAAWIAPHSSPLVIPWRDWRADLEAATWQSGGVRTVAILVGVVGLVVLLIGLFGRRHDVYLSDPVPEVTVTTSPRSLARAVGHEVRSHDGVVSASVMASSGRVTVKASTLDAPDQVKAAVGERVDRLLERLPLSRRPRVSVSVTVNRGVQ